MLMTLIIEAQYVWKIGVQFCRKEDVAGYTPLFFGHGRVKVGVDQSTNQLCPFHAVNK